MSARLTVGRLLRGQDVPDGVPRPPAPDWCAQVARFAGTAVRLRGWHGLEGVLLGRPDLLWAKLPRTNDWQGWLAVSWRHTPEPGLYHVDDLLDDAGRPLAATLGLDRR